MDILSGSNEYEREEAYCSLHSTIMSATESNPNMASQKNLLITGATGKQGGATISALLAGSPDTFHILALTRNPSSPRAKSLIALSPNVSVLKGDLSDCPAVFRRASRPIWGVFSVQLPDFQQKGPQGTEEKQGKALVDAAVANGVQHFVYASVERGGPERSETDPTDVPHFASKYAIEQHLKVQAAESTQRMSWTILRSPA